MRKRTKDFDLPPRCERLPSGSIRYRPLSGPYKMLGTKHTHLADIWTKWRELTEYSDRVTLSDVAEDWFKTHNFNELSPRTQKDYRDVCSIRPLKAFKGWDVAQIEPSDVHRYREARGKESIRRANYELAWLRHVLGHAVELGAITDNPCRDLKPLKYKAKRKNYVTDLTYQMMFVRASAPLRVAMEISYCTGIRLGDVLKLRWDDIGDSMRIVEAKTGREYQKVLSPRLSQALDAAKKLPGQPFGGSVVRNRWGNRYSSDGFQANWQRTKNTLPLHRQFTFHQIRHKAITDATEKQVFSMHRDAKMLGVYDHEIPVSPSH